MTSEYNPVISGSSLGLGHSGTAISDEIRDDLVDLTQIRLSKFKDIQIEGERLTVLLTKALEKNNQSKLKVNFPL